METSTQMADRPRAVAQDLGAEDVAVKLLKADDQGKEPQGRPRVDDHQNHQTGDGADDRSKKGDNVGDAHHDADQHGIWDAENQAKDKAEHTDDGRVDQLAIDKAYKYPGWHVRIPREASPPAAWAEWRRASS